MTLDILPLTGLGPLRFGMSAHDVRKMLGSEASGASATGNMLYFGNDLNARFDDGKLAMIGASRRATGIAYRGIDIFAADPFEVLRAVERDAGGAVEDVGFIVFPAFEMSLTGFHDDDLSQKAVTLSVKGEWTSIVDSMRPVSFLD